MKKTLLALVFGAMSVAANAQENASGSVASGTLGGLTTVQAALAAGVITIVAAVATNTNGSSAIDDGGDGGDGGDNLACTTGDEFDEANSVCIGTTNTVTVSGTTTITVPVTFTYAPFVV